MKIINYICIGDKIIDMATLTPDEKKEIGSKLNEQALTAIGYKKKTPDKTA